MSWDTNSGATYTLEYVKDGTTLTESITGTGNTVSHEVMNLVCGTAYAFHVSGKGDGSPYSTVPGDTSEVTETILCIPTAPTVEISDPTLNTLTVSWNALPGLSYALAYRLSPNAGARSAGTRQDDIFVTFEESIGVPSPADVSRTLKNLKCGTSYDAQVTVVGIGYPFLTDPDYANTGNKTGSTLPCLAPTPAGFEIDGNVEITQTSITFKWNTTDEVVAYKLERSADNDKDTWPQRMGPNYAGHVIENIAGTMQEMTGLECGTTYYFRLSGKGDGDPYSSTDYGNPTDPPEMASTTVKCTPQNLTITPLAERRALLSWSSVDNVTANYVIKARKFPDPTSANPPPDYADVLSRSLLTHEINLDSILGDGLAEHPAYQFIVQATVDVDPGPTVTTMTFESAPIIIVDTPILSASGSSVGAAMDEGKAALKWTPIENVLFNDSDYENGFYSFRYRRFASFDGHRHTEIGWKPGQAPDPAAVPPLPAKENFAQAEIASTTDSGGRIGGVQFTLGPDNSPDDSPPDKDNGLTLFEVYAIQLRYEVDINGVTHRVFAVRDVYVWPSNRAAGNGERVATFPLNYPLTRTASGTYEFRYRICEDTFNSLMNGTQLEWVTLINHAFMQWQLATDGLVTMVKEAGDCADYSPFVTHIANQITRMLTAGVDNDTIKGHVTGMIEEFRKNGLTVNSVGFFDLHDSIDDDISRNEVIMVNDSDRAIKFLTIHVPHTFSTDIGLAECGTGCASRSNYNGGSTTDIFLQRSNHDNDLIIKTGNEDIVFNTCPNMGGNYNYPYSSLVHEAGHALGIRGGKDGMGAEKEHPFEQILSAIMSYGRGEPLCSPHPLDVLAIFAIYQTGP